MIDQFTASVKKRKLEQIILLSLQENRNAESVTASPRVMSKLINLLNI